MAGLDNDIMATTVNNTKRQENEQVENFSFTEFLKICLKHWGWFACSLIFFVGIGAFYLIRKQPVYERSMELLIKDNDSGGSIGDMGGAFAGLGLFSSNTSVYNELIALLSPSIMYQVVDRLDLTMNYSIKDKPLRWKTLYGSNLPIDIVFDDIDPDQSVGLKGTILPDKALRISEFIKYDSEGKKTVIKQEAVLHAGTSLEKTPIGKISSQVNPEYRGTIKEESAFQASHQGRLQTVETYLTKVKGDLANQDADVISLSIDDVSTQRADDILNTIVEVYNERWISDKNKMAIATSKFIDDRIATIQLELGDVENEISDYKSNHMITNVQEAAKISLERQATGMDALPVMHNQISMAEYLLDYINNPQNSNRMIPVNTGIGSPTLEALIGEYDTELNSKIMLESNSSSANPLVADMERELKQQREAIVRGLDNHIIGLKKNLSTTKEQLGQTGNALAQIPVQAKDLLGVERQQAVKAELYLFLLQKKEENELSQKFTADNTRIITPPFGSLQPIAPKKKLIMALLILIALAIPGVFFYIKEASDDTIKSRKDMDGLSLPFIGEIPLIGKKKSKLARFLNKKEKGEESLIVVEEGNRDIANEAFRVIRSNIDMMIGKGKGCQVVMLTSANVGSGKSFITYNLGLTYGLKRKKVLMIDCDLRHCSLSMFVNSPSKGLTEYLSDDVSNWKNLVINVEETVGLLPVGHRPPNPAELLENGRLESLLKEAREEYDIILLDCPPVDIVVDTQIVQQLTDRVIFVVRAGLFRRQDLPTISQRDESSKHHMSVILNGTESSRSLYHANGSSNYYTTNK